MNVIKKIKMRKGPKIVLSTIFIFALVLTTGLFLSKGNIIGKLFADKKENKSISEKIIEDYGENEDDVAFDGLEVSFVDKRGETGDPVDYGVLDSNGSSAKDVYLKIKNKFPTATHINISGASTSGMNVNFENNSIDLSAGNTAGDTIYIAVDYSAPSVSDGGVYSFVAYLNYTFDDVYDGDSSSLKTFSKSIAYAASYKATPSNNYNTITMLISVVGIAVLSLNKKYRFNN